MPSAEVALAPHRNGSLSFPEFVMPEAALPLDESILVYLSLPGSVTPMRVLESDSIESVKMRIQCRKGFVVRSQKLVCGGRELSRSNSLVREYGITNGNVLHLVLRLSDIQTLEVQTASGKSFTLFVERARDVGYVKQQIAKKEEVEDFVDQEIVCDGELLEDKRRINDLCRENDDAVIHLFVRKSAKVRAIPVEKSFEVSIVAPTVGKQETSQCKGGNGNSYANDSSKDGNHISFQRATTEQSESRALLEPLIVNQKAELSTAVWEMIYETNDGLHDGSSPVRSMVGTGGAYFMQDSHGEKFVSVFKPIDEEPMAVNNPRGLPLSSSGEGLKKGTRVGEGAIREVAAYILDHPKSGRRSLHGGETGFAGVPPTVLIKCLHEGFNHSDGLSVKIGSLQKFIKNNGSCEDIGPAAFPSTEVHKISVLDVRLANADRHAGNILLRKEANNGQIQLIPIDHGYCLPESFQDCTFDWLYWPQARLPYNQDTVEYIKSLDADEDIALLKFHGWNIPNSCARILKISTMLLKKGVERRLTPFAIGSIMCRVTLNKESLIEEIVQEALDSVLPISGEDEFIATVSRIMDRRLDEVSF